MNIYFGLLEAGQPTGWGIFIYDNLTNAQIGVFIKGVLRKGIKYNNNNGIWLIQGGQYNE